MQSTLSHKTYQHLRQQLMAGKLSPGERLITRAIASEVGVSLGPVREAINRLAAEKLVTYTPGAGASVREPNARDLQELYVLRQANESYAAREAAIYITEEELDALETVVEEGFRVADKIRGLSAQRATKAVAAHWYDVEEQFHNILVGASRNSLLIKVIEEHRAIACIFDIQRQRPELITVQVAEDTCRNHRRLLQCLRERNSSLAQQLMVEHIGKAQRNALIHFRKFTAQ